MNLVSYIIVGTFIGFLAVLAFTTSKLPDKMSDKWLKEQKQDEEGWKEIWKE